MDGIFAYIFSLSFDSMQLQMIFRVDCLHEMCALFVCINQIVAYSARFSSVNVIRRGSQMRHLKCHRCFAHRICDFLMPKHEIVSEHNKMINLAESALSIDVCVREIWYFCDG